MLLVIWVVFECYLLLNKILVNFDLSAVFTNWNSTICFVGILNVNCFCTKCYLHDLFPHNPLDPAHGKI